MDARRTERRNRNVLNVHEDFEYRATPQTQSAAILKAASYFSQPLRWNIQNGTPTDNSISNSANG